MTLQLDGIFNSEYLWNKTGYRQHWKLQEAPTMSQNFMNFGPQMQKK